MSEPRTSFVQGIDLSAAISLVVGSMIGSGIFIVSADIARQVLELDGPRIWNLKVHRVGGLTEACRIQRIATGAGIALWAGTMPESGLGSQAAIAMAAMPGFVYPSDVEPSARWFGAGVDVIELIMDREGRMPVATAPAGDLLDAARFRSATRSIAFCDPPDTPSR